MKTISEKSRLQSGFGLLETMTGLAVFLILAGVGTKAFRNVVDNHKAAAEMKALTDAVTETAEKLGGQSVATLTAPSSGYLAWSAPKPVGLGEFLFRFRVFPSPSISGAPDTTVVGLEVEAGSAGGAFVATRSFATLISPRLFAKTLGQSSTAEERQAEAAFHASLEDQIAALSKRVVSENQDRLNSFACYDQGQCCGFMKTYFANPGIKPQDGLNEKCFYRCAMAGNVSVKTWNGACGTDFCAISPWKTKDQCCAAIQAGQCEPGSACANVCVSCVGEDGSTCAPPICNDGWWNDFFDCANGTYCNGQPLPDGDIPGWGNVKALCGTPTCGTIHSQCDFRLQSCCQSYWGPIARGETPDPQVEICKTISSKSECCDNYQLDYYDWTIYCGTDGKVISAKNKIDGKWYCGFSGGGWDNVCSFTQGCSTTFMPVGAPSGSGNACPAWSGVTITNPWDKTYPPPPSPPPPPSNNTPSTPTTSGGNTNTNNQVPGRVPSQRGGSVFNNGGGRE